MNAKAKRVMRPHRARLRDADLRRMTMSAMNYSFLLKKQYEETSPAQLAPSPPMCATAHTLAANSRTL
jgi:hypothetical protein